MKQLLLAFVMAFCGVLTVSAQTTATNFTASDCSSTSHTLFTDLDGGKIVVLVWVMPCSMCIGDAKGAYDAVQSFATSNPGKVLYYLADDVGDAGCSTLSSWATNNGIGSAATIFSNSGTTIDESNYGGSGMPHVVVMGGSNHKIYLNKLNGSNNKTAIQNAISAALSPTSVGETTIENGTVTVYPNPASNNITVGFFLNQGSAVTLDIYDIRGAKVQSFSQVKSAGQQTVNFPLEKSLSNGFYQMRLSASGASATAGFTISR